jgi:glycosyltransferase involved in cell wall biosynthesis
MPSFHETFGLTYIEALSQGLPVVHSRGQGVDGFFSAGTVASAVDPSVPRAIADGIREVVARLPSVRRVCRYEARRFAWQHIGNTYRDVYRSILGDEF